MPLQARLRACVLTAVALAVAQQLQFVTTMRERQALNESDDILQFAESHPRGGHGLWIDRIAVARAPGADVQVTAPIFSTSQRSASTNSSGRPAGIDHSCRRRLPCELLADSQGEAPFSGRNGWPLRAASIPASFDGSSSRPTRLWAQPGITTSGSVMASYR